MNDVEGEVAGYVRLFVRVPKKNRDAFARVQARLAEVFRMHGVVSSEFFRLSPAKTFGGFTGVGELIASEEGDEVWLEIESYRDEEDKRRAVAEVGEDAAAGPLFAQTNLNTNKIRGAES